MSLTAYAIQHREDHRPIGLGLSVIDAWNAAERMTGDSTMQMRRAGYILVEGFWTANAKPPPLPEKPKRDRNMRRLDLTKKR